MIYKFKRPTLTFLGDLLAAIALNSLLSMALSLPLYTKGSELGGAFIYSAIPFIAHYLSLNLIVGLALYMAGFIVASRKALTLIGGVMFAFLQGLLLVDTRVYMIYHFHLNSMVWNLIMTEGITDSVVIGKGTVMTFLAMLGAIVAVMSGAIYAVRSLIPRINPKLYKRYARAALLAAFALIASAKVMDAYGDLAGDTAITKNFRLYPFYQPLNVRRPAYKFFGYKPSADLSIKGHAKTGAPILYPKAPITIDPAKDKRYNIILLVAEGLRFDLLNDETMPYLTSFASENINFKNHYSGGNDSRFGVFSLLYGLEGSYWHTFLAHNTPPVLIDTLKSRGYDFRILSSTPLKFPEFRSTAFLHVLDKIEDSLPNTTSDVKDRMLTDRIVSYIKQDKREQPFFLFMFFNSTHQAYDYPKEFEHFVPVLEGQINYFSDTDKEKAAALRNRYKNAALYEDYLISMIVEALKDKGMMDNTVIMITGDHGEEFYERGFLGHTSSFDDYQTRTVSVLHYPGAGPRTVQRVTSHMDLVPMLMDDIGVTSPRADYTQGLPLMSNAPRAFIPVAGWDKLSLIDADNVFTFSTETYNMGMFEVRNRSDYSPVANPRDVIKQKREMLIEGSRAMSEFLK